MVASEWMITVLIISSSTGDSCCTTNAPIDGDCTSNDNVGIGMIGSNG